MKSDRVSKGLMDRQDNRAHTLFPTIYGEGSLLVVLVVGNALVIGIAWPQILQASRR